MRIVVPIKRVASLEDDFQLDDGQVDPDDLDHDLNEWDRFSLQAAIELTDAHGGEVVVATVGDEDAEEELRACLALGAARAVRLDPEGLDPSEPISTARVLAAVVGRESADLVLCGVQSSDAVNGATGVALAAFLALPRVAVVKALEATPEGLTVDRELEGGAVERLRVGLPALLTIQTGANEPGYATLRAIKQARELPLEVLSLEEVGLDEASVAAACGRREQRLEEPPKTASASMLEGDPEAIATQILEIVHGQRAA